MATTILTMVPILEAFFSGKHMKLKSRKMRKKTNKANRVSKWWDNMFYICTNIGAMS